MTEETTPAQAVANYQSSGDGSIAFVWAGELRTFNIGKIKSLRELQAIRDSGPMEIYRRLENETWRTEDYREVIRLGLLGGGVASPIVAILIQNYVDEAPPISSVVVAKAILAAGLSWPKDDALGELKEKTSPAESSSQDSSALVQQSATRQRRRQSARFGNSPRQSKESTKQTPRTSNHPT
jgi:hypothetical protein